MASNSAIVGDTFSFSILLSVLLLIPVIFDSLTSVTFLLFLACQVSIFILHLLDIVIIPGGGQAII
nr:MAG TPA: hypothetical protein [Caudoviricetes sp.]